MMNKNGISIFNIRSEKTKKRFDMKIKKKLAISDSGFVFDPQSGESYSLNETGAEILNMLKESKSNEEIKDYFITNYKVDESDFERAFMDFTSMLKFYNIYEENEEN